jgi:hypothetical protein
MEARYYLTTDKRCMRLRLSFGAWPFLRPEGVVAAVVMLFLSSRRVQSSREETGSKSEKTKSHGNSGAVKMESASLSTGWSFGGYESGRVNERKCECGWRRLGGGGGWVYSKRCRVW